jgi:ABC-type oligopeptide transport system substrate-binding subunit
MNVRIDTVFIEKKKNFWGKEKTTVNTKSDSISFDVIDSVDTDTAKN